MAKSKHIIVKTTAELAEVLGLDPHYAVTMEFKALLNKKIVDLFAASGLTHQELATLAKTSRTRTTAILNGNTLGVSSDLLLRILFALGCNTKPSFSVGKMAA